MSETIAWGEEHPDRRARLDRVCNEFSDCWRKRRSRPIEDFLNNDVPESDRRLLFSELLQIELDYRFNDGQNPSAEEYRVPWPEYREVIDGEFARRSGPPELVV